MTRLLTLLSLTALAVTQIAVAAPASAIIKTLAPLKADAYGMSIRSIKVKGTDAKSLLTDYAERVKGFDEEYTVSLRLAAKDFPEADDGQQVVGLARIIDVIDFINQPSGDNGYSAAENAARTALIRDLLFQVRNLGGLIGVESGSWSTCGVTFPGVFILDVKAKEVITLSPSNTDC